LLFSGSIFYEADAGLQVTQIPWDRETTYRLPVRVWRDMIDMYYPNTAWLCLRRDVFDRLNLYKTQQGIPTWEQTLECILPKSEPLAPANGLLSERPASAGGCFPERSAIGGGSVSNHDDLELAAEIAS
jgi:hypothetical protein